MKDTHFISTKQTKHRVFCHKIGNMPFEKITKEEKALYFPLGLRKDDIFILHIIEYDVKKSGVCIRTSKEFAREISCSERKAQGIIKKLEDLTLIKRKTNNVLFPDSKIRAVRKISLTHYFSTLSLGKKSRGNTLNQYKKSKATKTHEITEVSRENQESLVNTALLGIFQKKTKELGLKVSHDRLEYEAAKFDNFYKTRGFRRWTRPDGTRMTYRAVTNWILSDKFGVFKESSQRKEEEHRRKAMDILQAQREDKRRQEEERQGLYHELTAFYAEKSAERFRQFGRGNDDNHKEIMLNLITKYREHPYLEDFLVDNEMEQYLTMAGGQV